MLALCLFSDEVYADIAKRLRYTGQYVSAAVREQNALEESVVGSDKDVDGGVQANNHGDDDVLCSSGSAYNDADDTRDSFGDVEEQSSAHEHDVGHSGDGNEWQTCEDPANAENDKADNGESSGLESVLDSPYDLNTMIASLDVAGNARNLSARVADAALPPGEPSYGAVDESISPPVDGVDDDDDFACDRESTDGMQGADQHNETQEEVEEDSGDTTTRIAPILLNMARPEVGQDSPAMI